MERLHLTPSVCSFFQSHQSHFFPPPLILPRLKSCPCWCYLHSILSYLFWFLQTLLILSTLSDSSLLSFPPTFSKSPHVVHNSFTVIPSILYPSFNLNSPINILSHFISTLIYTFPCVSSRFNHSLLWNLFLLSNSSLFITPSWLSSTFTSSNNLHLFHIHLNFLSPYPLHSLIMSPIFPSTTP